MAKQTIDLEEVITNRHRIEVEYDGDLDEVLSKIEGGLVGGFNDAESVLGLLEDEGVKIIEFIEDGSGDIELEFM